MTKKITKIKLPKSKVPKGMVNQSLSLQAMQATEGWAVMLQNLLLNIEYLEECILEKKQDDMPLNDLEIDRLRDKRGFLKELVEMPQKYAEKLADGTAKPENFDPYYNDVKELIRERKK